MYVLMNVLMALALLVVVVGPLVLLSYGLRCRNPECGLPHFWSHK